MSAQPLLSSNFHLRKCEERIAELSDDLNKLNQRKRVREVSFKTLAGLIWPLSCASNSCIGAFLCFTQDRLPCLAFQPKFPISVPNHLKPTTCGHVCETVGIPTVCDPCCCARDTSFLTPVEEANYRSIPKM